MKAIVRKTASWKYDIDIFDTLQYFAPFNILAINILASSVLNILIKNRK